MKNIIISYSMSRRQKIWCYSSYWNWIRRNNMSILHTVCGASACRACPSRPRTLAVIRSRSLCRCCIVVAIWFRNSALTLLSSFFVLCLPLSRWLSVTVSAWPLALLYPLVNSVFSFTTFSVLEWPIPFAVVCTFWVDLSVSFCAFSGADYNKIVYKIKQNNRRNPK